MKKQTGFTLLELMLAITIAGILAMVAIPSFTYITRNNCMTTTATSIVTSLQFARSEAIKRRDDVFVTAGPPGGAAGSDDNEWGAGWHVWTDLNNNGSYDDGEELRVTAPTCTSILDESSADLTEFTYGSDGFIDNQATFEVCIDRTEESGRRVNISATGRPSTTTGFTCSST